MAVDVQTTLGDPARLAAVRHRLRLLGPESGEALDWLTRLASNILRVPVAFVSLVDDEVEHIESFVGLPDPWAETGRMPLSHSFGRLVVASGTPVLIEDARQHPLARGSPAAELAVIAYAGIPLTTAGGHTLGAFCVVDSNPRGWTLEELEILKDLAGSALTEIELRVAIHAAEHKAAEAERERAEKVAILESISDAFFAVDRAWCFTYVNRQARQLIRRLARRDPGELLGANFWELVPELRRTRFEREHRRAMEDQVPVHFEEYFPAWDLWFEVSAYPAADGLSVYLRDVSERKHAEEALRASEERYRRFFEEDLSGAFVSTPDGRLLACNPAFARMLGYDSAEEAVAAPVSAFYSDPGAREAFLDVLRRNGKLELYEEELRTRDGRTIHVIENVVGVFDDRGELREIKGYLFDVSERKALEEQLRHSQKMEAVGRLAGGVAHDFNNVLTAIKGYADFLVNDLDAEDPRRQDAEEIRKAANRAAALTRQLLAFSRRQNLQPQVLDLNAVVSDLQKMLRPLIGADIESVTSLAPDLWTVRADPGQIEQVIMNLAVNARDAMPDGGRFTIETRNETLTERDARRLPGVPPGPYVVLTVSDTGHGMERDVLERIFEPFFTTKEKGRGTGLGLSTVYGIIQQSGGHISVSSEPGHGTTFRIYLPRVEDEVEAETAAPQEAPTGAETVLVVEDEGPVRALVRKVLRKRGYSVLEAENGLEALRVSNGHGGPIHLVVTDLVMPGMGGIELADRLAELRPDTRILFISGYAAESGILQGALERGTAFLEKPFAPEILARRVREVLDQRED